jgi:hypothetical protein
MLNSASRYQPKPHVRYTSDARPPTTLRWCSASFVYMAPQRLPGPMAAVSLSSESLISFIRSIHTAIPFSMLKAPGNATCPPLLRAKGHWVRRDSSTADATTRASVGWKTHDGATDAAWLDQQPSVKALYSADSLARTLGLKKCCKELHCGYQR